MIIMKATRFSLALGLVLFSTQIVQASYEKGQAALDQNDAIAAVEEWQSGAKRGDARAQFALGQIFEKGAEGVEADLVEAYAWFKLAAAQDFEDANKAIERLRVLMSPEELRVAQARSFAALGLWYRDFTGQDEAAFQEAKAAAVVPQAQSASVSQDNLAEQRAAAQRELIAQRKAEAEAREKALEESRQAAILAAQQAAEEAKRQAELRQQKIDEQRNAIAERDAQQSQNSLAAAKARLADLMAKQQGSTAAVAGGAAIASAASAPQSTAVKPKMVEPQQAVTEAGGNAVPTDKAAKPVEKAPVSETQVVSVPSASDEPKVEKTALATAPVSAQASVASKVVEPPLTKSKSEALTALKSFEGLDKKAVEEIFEQAKIADLDNAAAQSEIEQSLVRIEALKWSLISGAKGDQAAPKLNKVLMSKMSPVQIAEANRLASEWLIERQKQL
jgi:hypothetical protein